MAANKKSRKGTATGASHGKSSTSAPVRAWSVGGRVYCAATRREALRMRAEELGLG